MVASIIAFVGFGLGVSMANVGALNPLQVLLRASVIPGPEGPATLNSVLAGLLGVARVNPWVLIVPTVLGLGAWLWWAPRTAARGGWGWPMAGAAIGVIGVVAWPLSEATGRAYGLSVTEPIFNLFQFLLRGEVRFLNWAAFMWLGIPLGAFLAARGAGEFAWRAPAPLRLLQALGGGALMGVGGGIAGGCNIGHSLTGAPLLAMSSLSATAAIVAGVWTASFLLFGDVRLERSVRHAQRA